MSILGSMTQGPVHTMQGPPSYGSRTSLKPQKRVSRRLVPLSPFSTEKMVQVIKITLAVIVGVSLTQRFYVE